MKHWTLDDMKSQEGKVAIITGGSSGIGFHAALELARKGARVIIASDDVDKGILALKMIADQVPHADITFEPLDLADLESVKVFSSRMRSSLSSLDILILNGGIAGIPKRMETASGFEMHLAVNYLGHFALSAYLFPLLTEVADSRVVAVGSLDHHHAQVNFKDLQLKKNYQATKAYAQSKLALMLFSFELHRRAKGRGLFIKSLAVHPGAVRTHIFDRGPEISRSYYHPEAILKRLSIKTFGQSPEKGALPILFAATSRDAKSGEYYGPDGFMELWGNHPVKVKLAIQASNLTAAGRLWEESERLTKAQFRFEGMGLSHHH